MTPSPMTHHVLLKTDLGDILLEVYPDAAPLTTHNFLRYVTEGRYGGATFYRVVREDNQPDDPVKIAVIQGGLGMGEHPDKYPSIPHETTEQSGLRHTDGTLSMGRLAPGSANAEFFICIGDQPELDFGGRRNPDGQGFAAFGRVVRGMDVVQAIHRQVAEGQSLTAPVAIRSAREVGVPDAATPEG